MGAAAPTDAARPAVGAATGRQVKLSTLVDSMNEAVLQPLSEADFTELFEQYRALRGDYPSAEVEPTSRVEPGELPDSELPELLPRHKKIHTQQRYQL